MVDKVLYVLIICIVILFLVEQLVPGEKHVTVIDVIRIEQGMAVSNRTTHSYQDNVAYFDDQSVILNNQDMYNFKRTDSIAYTLTPVMKNLKSISNLKTGYSTKVHTYVSLTFLILLTVAGQALNVSVAWSQKNKDLIQMLLFCLIFVIGYIFIFK